MGCHFFASLIQKTDKATWLLLTYLVSRPKDFRNDELFCWKRKSKHDMEQQLHKLHLAGEWKKINLKMIHPIFQICRKLLKGRWNPDWHNSWTRRFNLNSEKLYSVFLFTYYWVKAFFPFPRHWLKWTYIHHCILNLSRYLNSHRCLVYDSVNFSYYSFYKHKHAHLFSLETKSPLMYNEPMSFHFLFWWLYRIHFYLISSLCFIETHYRALLSGAQKLLKFCIFYS